jgi:hypothetical protein
MTVFSHNVTTPNLENMYEMFSCLMFTGLCNEFRVRGCSRALCFPIRLKAKDSFHAVTVLLLYILQSCDLKYSAYCIDVCLYCTLLHDPTSVDISVAYCFTGLRVRRAIITDCRRQKVWNWSGL